MKISSWNVNGLRAIYKKGFLNEFLEKENPDIMFFQEIKAEKEKLEGGLKCHPNYQQFYNSAVRAGYAGTGVWIRKNIPIKNFSTGMPNYKDEEGRICRVDREEWTIFGVYFPNGGKSKEAWYEKLKFYNDFLSYINALREEGKRIIFCGDVNCAHQEIDIARPKENKNSIGFLPEERESLTNWIKNGWKDVFREKFPERVQYSWWAPYAKARERNVGWRIDYFFIDQSLLSKVKEIEYLEEQKGSDHCPIIITID